MQSMINPDFTPDTSELTGQLVALAQRVDANRLAGTPDPVLVVELVAGLAHLRITHTVEINHPQFVLNHTRDMDASTPEFDVKMGELEDMVRSAFEIAYWGGVDPRG
jgi:hypothetical protein